MTVEPITSAVTNAAAALDEARRLLLAAAPTPADVDRGAALVDLARETRLHAGWTSHLERASAREATKAATREARADGLCTTILAALADAEGPMALHTLRARVRGSTAAVGLALEELRDRGMVVAVVEGKRHRGWVLAAPAGDAPSGAAP